MSVPDKFWRSLIGCVPNSVEKNVQTILKTSVRSVVCILRSSLPFAFSRTICKRCSTYTCVHLLHIFQDKINFTSLLLYTFFSLFLCLSRPFFALFLSLRLDRSENDGRLAPRVKGKASGRLHGGGRSTRRAERRGTRFETTLSSVRNAFAVSPAPASICPSPFLPLSAALSCRANLLTLFVVYKSKIKVLLIIFFDREYFFLFFFVRFWTLRLWRFMTSLVWTFKNTL